MTTLATTSPVLKRLFERLDSAPRPQSGALAEVMKTWRTARAETLYPSPKAAAVAGLPERVAASFILVKAPGGDWQFESVGAEAERLLGLSRLGAGLCEASDRRAAARLRRLCEEVTRMGEPLEASFGVLSKGCRIAEAEMVVAPLATDGALIDAILGGYSVEPCAPVASGRAGQSCSAVGQDLALFALGAAKELGTEVAGLLGLALTAHEERSFEDGEHKTRPLVDVRNKSACVLSGLHGDSDLSANDKLCRLLFFVACLKDAGVRRVSVVAPYLCYSRKDRQTKPFDPITTRYLAQLFEAVGTDHIATVDVHNPAAFQNAFRCDTDHIETTSAFVEFVMRIAPGGALAVVSPDAGGMKRAEKLREALEGATASSVAKGFMEKQRSMGKVTGDLFAGDVAGRTAIIVDDMISTGGSMIRTAAECRRRGAARVFCLATHGLFSGGAPGLFETQDIDRVVVTDSVPVSHAIRERAGSRLEVLPAAPLLARSIAEWFRP